MLFYNNLETNPYYNLALEEFLLKSREEDIFMLWQNEPTIVVGKHQNTLAEININFQEQNQIKVARRLSGGGTVFHDFGNLNFTFIINSSEGKMVDFGKYTNQILSILNGMGIPAESNQRHDLTIAGKKISGNAEHIYKKRVLHHGTLLFNSNLDFLEQAILSAKAKYTDIAVQSIRSKVCNILPYIPVAMDIKQFRNNLMTGMVGQYKNSMFLELNPREILEVKHLSKEKYSTWEWIYGYSPQYEINNQVNVSDKSLKIKLNIKKGIISNSAITGNLFENELLNQINNDLIGVKHQKECILQLVEQNFFFPAIMDFSIKEFVENLF